MLKNDTKSRFDTRLEHDRQTDGQNYYINILRQHCCADEQKNLLNR